LRLTKKTVGGYAILSGEYLAGVCELRMSKACFLAAWALSFENLDMNLLSSVSIGGASKSAGLLGWM